jgi:hypothetical protein
MLLESYKKPKTNETTAHAGNYGGVLVQIEKLIASTIHEFFIFLEKNAEIFEESEFKQVLSRLSKFDAQFWHSMVAAANNNLSSVSNLLKAIVKVRSNIAFHYDHSGKILRNGYISRFFGKVKDNKNKYAYYSLGDSISDIRFYFSDAAVEESLFIATGKKPKEDSAGDESLEKYRRQIIETINVMSNTIAVLLKNYIQMRRNRPK